MRHYHWKRLAIVLGLSALMVPALIGGTIRSAQGAGPYPVTIMGQWASAEKTDFLAILSYCDSHYNIKATYDQISGDLIAELTTQVQGGNPPDLATLSTPSTIEPFVVGGALKPLTFLNMDKLKSQYAPFWLNLGTIKGQLYAIYMKADVKSLIWYNPKKFAAGHYTIPKTWNQLIALSQQMVKDGKHPWAVGASDGWTLTDFLENVYLQTAGPQMYQKWINHQIPWTDPSIVHAFQVLNQIFANDNMIAGGRTRALGQRWDQGAVQMVTDPQAEFFQEATFVAAGLAGDLPKDKEGVDFAPFSFPMIKSWPTTPTEVGPNGVEMFNDTPGARALMTCLTDPNALAQWARLGGFISPNSATSPSSYPDALTRAAANQLIAAGKAGLLVGDASDLMPAALGSGYEFTALQKWFKNPTSIMPVLQGLENEAKKDYKGM